MLTPDIFGYLEKAVKKIPEGEEFQVQPAMREMIKDDKLLFACEVSDARYYDTGNKLEYVKTVVDFALKHDDIKDEFMDYLRSLAV